MLVIVAGFVPFAERHQQLLAIIREFENLVMDVVGDPDVVLGIIRTDRNRVRPAAILEELVPLCPRLGHLAGRVDDDDAVAKLGRWRGRLLAGRAPEACKIVGQFFRKLQLAPVRDEDSVRRLREDAAGRTPDVSRFGHRQG